MYARLLAACLFACSLAVPVHAQSDYNNIQAVMAHLRSTGKCFNLSGDPYKVQACNEGAEEKLRVLVGFTVFTPTGLYTCSGNFLYSGFDEQHGTLEESKVRCPSQASVQIGEKNYEQDLIFLQAISQLASWLRMNEANL